MPQKKNKGLGRGLDALFTEFDETATADETVVELNLGDIRSNPYQPRKTFDETSLSELSDSIRKQGVFQPIIVRQSKVSGYEIIAGERRYRASKMAKRTTIPAIVRDLNEEEMMEIAVLENLQREDLTPLEEAQAYNTLMENLNLTQAQVSEKLGKSRPYIANYLRLLSLPKAVKDFLQKGSLSMGQARTLLSVKDKKKLVALAEKTVKEGLTVRQLESIVNELNGERDKQKKVKKPANLSPYLKHSEELLREKFSTKVAIKSSQKTGKGKIEIDYLSNDDLNRILEILDITLD
ncbi:ParB/RepB/Spo0J family partition protein [Ligilactobacillus ruminis]|uniref:ParB/RepB/Spo0J family partition protein n=1 Tax=Ligilactobacillus ruminis TaxID=1623 RepID=UPI0014740C63|nr:ParB/RepB/Spo0J family partition protein [Ligilactobacillus ruminis]NME32725.1 ParB/RepB/Spo0J family partition protein [Ligilactobacillus ruminis]